MNDGNNKPNGFGIAAAAIGGLAAIGGIAAAASSGKKTSLGAARRGVARRPLVKKPCGCGR